MPRQFPIRGPIAQYGKPCKKENIGGARLNSVLRRGRSYHDPDCGDWKLVALAGCDAAVDQDAAISGVGSTIRLRRRTTRRRCDSCSGLEAAIAQRTQNSAAFAGSCRVKSMKLCTRNPI